MALDELATAIAAEAIEATIHVLGGMAIAIENNPQREATRDIDA